jgi:hypothetical protein
VTVLTKDEREHRLRVIREHMGELVGRIRAAHKDYRDVASWTLPVWWDPGEDPGALPWPVDMPQPPAKMCGRPVVFAGDSIVAHLTERTHVHFATHA